MKKLSKAIVAKMAGGGAVDSPEQVQEPIENPQDSHPFADMFNKAFGDNDPNRPELPKDRPPTKEELMNNLSYVSPEIMRRSMAGAVGSISGTGTAVEGALAKLLPTDQAIIKQAIETKAPAAVRLAKQVIDYYSKLGKVIPKP